MCISSSLFCFLLFLLPAHFHHKPFIVSGVNLNPMACIPLIPSLSSHSFYFLSILAFSRRRTTQLVFQISSSSQEWCEFCAAKGCNISVWAFRYSYMWIIQNCTTVCSCRLVMLARTGYMLWIHHCQRTFRLAQHKQLFTVVYGALVLCCVCSVASQRTSLCWSCRRSKTCGCSAPWYSPCASTLSSLSLISSL